MDTAQWPQEINGMKAIVTNTTTTTSCPKQQDLRSNNNNINNKVGNGSGDQKVIKEQVLNCPRCNSTNTKFCYYNNYSLSQPRYFCKTCRRYWTAGGSLRNIPVGGGSRKNKRPSSSSSSTTTSPPSKHIKLLPDLPNPKINGLEAHHQDLNLSFSGPTDQGLRAISELGHQKDHIFPSSSSSALELLNGVANSRAFMGSFMMPVAHQDPNYTNFCVDGIGLSSGGGNCGTSTSGGRLLFPFQELKQVSSTTNDNVPSIDHHHHHHDHDHQQSGDVSNGYWSGMLGGGGGGGSW